MNEDKKQKKNEILKKSKYAVNIGSSHSSLMISTGSLKHITPKKKK